jgi:decaprenylphospho-beta-D-erythro-pentofuranosid-2-ulose 2-reductase
MKPTVLILGACSEIGIAVANEFASNNYHIQLAARNVERLTFMKRTLETTYTTECNLYEFDAVKFNTHQSFFENLPIKPMVTVVVFGVQEDEAKAFTNWDVAYTIINTNFTGAISILNIVGNYCKQQKTGSIIGISSVAGQRGRGTKLLYASSKAAFTAYLSGLRNLLYHDGVHISTIKPGYVYTKMLGDFQPKKILTATTAQVGKATYMAVKKRKNVVYVKGVWRWIMLIINLIPEGVFKRMKI